MEGPREPPSQPAQDRFVAAASLPPAPAAALGYFGDRIDAARRYVALLADTGVTHGLVGPREVPRLWTRHILNCAVIADLVPADARVLDIGSGAGLPGIPLALARPDLKVTLVEPLLRRCRWLNDTLCQLEDAGLTTVRVHRSRVESLPAEWRAPVVTARAVARLGQLADWCAPMVAPGGILLALKGDSAAREVAEYAEQLRRAGFADVSVRQVGHGVVEPPSIVVECRRGAGRPKRGRSAGRADAPARRRGSSARRSG